MILQSKENEIRVDQKSIWEGEGGSVLPFSGVFQINKVLLLLFAREAKVATPAISSTSISSSFVIPNISIAISQAINLTPASLAEFDCPAQANRSS